MFVSCFQAAEAYLQLCFALSRVKPDFAFGPFFSTDVKSHVSNEIRPRGKLVA